MTNLRDAIELFKKINFEGSRITQYGHFYETDVTYLAMKFNELQSKDKIKPSLFCSAGGGDARDAVIAKLIFDCDVLYIEGDKRIFDLGKKNIDDLGLDIILANGDFLEDQTYLNQGVNFKDVDTFYNYINNYIPLIRKIERQSNNGTIFLLYDAIVAHNINTNLELVNYNTNLAVEEIKRYGFLNVFKKIKN